MYFVFPMLVPQWNTRIAPSPLCTMDLVSDVNTKRPPDFICIITITAACHAYNLKLLLVQWEGVSNCIIMSIQYDIMSLTWIFVTNLNILSLTWIYSRKQYDTAHVDLSINPYPIPLNQYRWQRYRFANICCCICSYSPLLIIWKENTCSNLILNIYYTISNTVISSTVNRLRPHSILSPISPNVCCFILHPIAVCCCVPYDSYYAERAG